MFSLVSSYFTGLTVGAWGLRPLPRVSRCQAGPLGGTRTFGCFLFHTDSLTAASVWGTSRGQRQGSEGLRLELRGDSGLHPPRTPAMYTHLGLSFPGCGMGRGSRAEGAQ